MPNRPSFFSSTVDHSLLNAAYRHCYEGAANRDSDLRHHGSFSDLPKMPMLVNPLRGRSRLFAMLGLTLRQPQRRVAEFFRDTLAAARRANCSSAICFACARQTTDKIQKLTRLATASCDPSRDLPSGPIIAAARRRRNRYRRELPRRAASPATFGFDAIARVKMRDGRPDRRFLMFRVRRYDPKLLSDALADLGLEDDRADRLRPRRQRPWH